MVVSMSRSLRSLAPARPLLTRALTTILRVSGAKRKHVRLLSYSVSTVGGAMFWVHAIIIVILGFALGVPAMNADAAQRPGNSNLNFNATTMVNAIVTA